jgi:hypothetical protein
MPPDVLRRQSLAFALHYAAVLRRTPPGRLLDLLSSPTTGRVASLSFPRSSSHQHRRRHRQHQHCPRQRRCHRHRASLAAAPSSASPSASPLPLSSPSSSRISSTGVAPVIPALCTLPSATRQLGTRHRRLLGIRYLASRHSALCPRHSASSAQLPPHPRMPRHHHTFRIRRQPAAAIRHCSDNGDCQRNVSSVSTASSSHRRRRHHPCQRAPKVGALDRYACACPAPTVALTPAAPVPSQHQRRQRSRCQHPQHYQPLHRQLAGVTRTTRAPVHLPACSSNEPASDLLTPNVTHASTGRNTSRRFCPRAPRLALALAQLTPTQVPPQPARSCYPASAASASVAPSHRRTHRRRERSTRFSLARRSHSTPARPQQ